MILIMEALVERKVVDNETVRLFAHKLLNWVKRGFPELGDTGGASWLLCRSDSLRVRSSLSGLGLGMTVHAAVTMPCFLQDPHKVFLALLPFDHINRHAWNVVILDVGRATGLGTPGRRCGPERCYRFLSVPCAHSYRRTGGVMRTSVLGCYHFSSIEEVIHNTKQICKVLLSLSVVFPLSPPRSLTCAYFQLVQTTHCDTRCVASCVAVTTAIAFMLQGRFGQGNNLDLQKLCEVRVFFTHSSSACGPFPGSDKHPRCIFGLSKPTGFPRFGIKGARSKIRGRIPEAHDSESCEGPALG
jgi:hypothetical protein